MKALSLTQPWATAIALGIKQWETRSWPTSYRGEICIHAAKGFPQWAKEFAADLEDERKVKFFDLPRQSIVAICELTECRQTETLVAEISTLEQQFGDYTRGRFAFRLINVRVLSDPVKVRGALGIWTVPDDVEALVRSRI